MEIEPALPNPPSSLTRRLSVVAAREHGVGPEQLPLIGIDADYRIHISEQLLTMNDGPMLEQGLKAMRGKTLLMPDRRVDRPDRDRLAARFELYQAAN